MFLVFYRRLKESFRQRTAELTEVSGRLRMETGRRSTVDRELVETKAELEVQRAFFEQMFLQSSVATQIFDSEGNRLRANSEWCRLFEVDETEIEDLPYNIFEDIAIIRSGLVPALRRVIDDGITAEWEVFIPAGIPPSTARWLLIKAHPIWASASRVANLVVHYDDISDYKRTQEKTQASLREKELLLKEIHHRVKNNMQLMKSMLNLQAAYVSDPHTLAMLTDSASRINAMALIHEKLYQSAEFGSVDIKTYLTYVADSLLQTFARQNLRVNLETDLQPLVVDIDTAIPCGLLANELMSNSMKHAFDGRVTGTMTLSFRLLEEKWKGPADQAHYQLIVTDDGRGIPEGSNWGKRDSLGLKLIDSLAKQLGGTIDMASSPDEGTRFTVDFRRPKVTTSSPDGVKGTTN